MRSSEGHSGGRDTPPLEGALRRLSLVLPEHELKGHAPLVYERLTKVSQPGSKEHRGLVAVALALARGSVTRCLPPGARIQLVPGLDALEAFVSGRVTHAACEKAARDARSLIFSALPSVEGLTWAAVEQASKLMPAGEQTALHEHAQHTLRRFLGLSVHHAVAAVCHALDAVEQAAAALPVPSDASGALAYSRTALGSVRSREFQTAALAQARWEHERAPHDPGVPRGALELQIFHEYLGARWRAHADEERRASEEFISWALGQTR